MRAVIKLLFPMALLSLFFAQLAEAWMPASWKPTIARIYYAMPLIPPLGDYSSQGDLSHD
jgi:hypothetical protein